MKKIILAVLVIFSLSFNVYASTVVVVTSLMDFNNSVNGVNTSVITETFDDDISAAETIIFGSGVTSRLVGGNISTAINNGDNEIIFGAFDVYVDGDGSDGALAVSFNFPTPIIGVGFDVLGITSTNVSIDGEIKFFDINTELDNFFGFFGLVSDTSFSSIQFTSGTVDFVGSFTMDNLVFATAVPIPATVWLMGAGLISFAGFSRREKSKGSVSIDFNSIGKG